MSACGGHTPNSSVIRNKTNGINHILYKKLEVIILLKGIDWQMVGFVSVTLLQEYITCHRLPQVYYWKQEVMVDIKDDNKKIA